MANFTFNCPECRQGLEAQDEWRGLALECPMCKKKIIVPGIEISKPEPEPEENSIHPHIDSEIIKKHLKYATIALQSGSLLDAEREYHAVLQEDPEHCVALYGEMFSKALQTSSAKPSLDHVVFSYNKIKEILIENNASENRLLDLRKTFFKDFIPIIAKENAKVINELVQSQQDAKLRENINALNALNGKVILSNPEALKHKERCDILIPYLKDILTVKHFIIDMLNISDIKDNPELLEQCKKMCEATLDMKKESSKVITLHRQIVDIQISERAKSTGVSIGEIKNIDLKNQLNKKKLWLALKLLLLSYLVYWLIYLLNAIFFSNNTVPSIVVGFCVIMLMSCYFSVKKSFKEIKKIKSEISKNEQLK